MRRMCWQPPGKTKDSNVWIKLNMPSCASYPSCRNSVPFLNGGTDHLSAALGVDGWLLFNPPNGIGQIRIFNTLRHPFAVIPPSKVIQPRLLIDALRELHEENEVVRAQVQQIVRATKKKASVLRQLALGIFSAVTLTVCFTRGDAHDAGQLGGPPIPKNRFAMSQRPRPHSRYRQTEHSTKARDRTRRVIS